MIVGPALHHYKQKMYCRKESHNLAKNRLTFSVLSFIVLPLARFIEFSMVFKKLSGSVTVGTVLILVHDLLIDVTSIVCV